VQTVAPWTTVLSLKWCSGRAGEGQMAGYWYLVPPLYRRIADHLPAPATTAMDRAGLIVE
jgi:hypothetical protein